MTGVAPRLARLLLLLLLAPLAWAATAAPASASTPVAPATPGAAIDQARPTADGVQLLVSLPPGEAVDLGGVSVQIAGRGVRAHAVAASSSDSIQRTSILAIDTSDSMRGARITEAKRAAYAYLAAAPANVRVGVLTFDDTVKVLVPPTLDRAPAREAIAGVTLTRSTALYDGVLGALEATGPGGADAGQRRILVLSDGKDTTATPLTRVLQAVKSSGVVVDAVSLQQSDADSGPLREMAAAGKGTVIDASQPALLSTAFTREAAALDRQLVVTAEVPPGTGTSADVSVHVPAGTATLTAAAYVPVRAATPPAAVRAALPTLVRAHITIPRVAVLGGVAAIGLGALLLVVALAVGAPPVSPEDRVGEQMRAYGMYAATAASGAAPGGGSGQGSLTNQARLAAEKALATNKTLEARVATRLDEAGLSLKPAEWLLLRGGSVVASALVGLLLGTANLLLGLLAFVIGVLVPGLYLRLKRGSRLRAFGHSLPDTLQLMSGSLSAGLSLAQSIDTIVREGQEPITSEFKRVIVESRLGVPLEDSLSGVATRMHSKDFGWVVMAIRIQREVGGNLAELLLTVADTLREREFLRRHVRALSAEGRLSCYILGGLPPGFFLYLVVTRPDYVQPMYSTAIGYLLLGAVAVLLSVGVFWMSRAAKVDL